MTFLTPLIVQEPDSGVGEWTLYKDLIWIGSQGDQFLVPTGFTTDFASVPRVFWIILPPTGRYTKAAVIHDYLYVHQPKVHRGSNRYARITREEADKIFCKIMRELNVPEWKITLMYQSVRLVGEPMWRRNRERLDAE